MFIQLYIAKVPVGSGSGENFPDPTKKVRIRNPGTGTYNYLVQEAYENTATTHKIPTYLNQVRKVFLSF